MLWISLLLLTSPIAGSVPFWISPLLFTVLLNFPLLFSLVNFSDCWISAFWISPLLFTGLWISPLLFTLVDFSDCWISAFGFLRFNLLRLTSPIAGLVLWISPLNFLRLTSPINLLDQCFGFLRLSCCSPVFTMASECKFLF